MKLLIIDSDRDHSDLLTERLASNGIHTNYGRTPQQVLASGLASGTSAVILDQGLRALSAGPHVRMLREAGVTQPLIVLSPVGDWKEKVECLDAGADDFLVKPIRSEEIAARLRAIIRRAAGQSTDRIVAGNLDLDLKSRCAWQDGQCLNLTRNAFRMLRHFMLNTGRVVSHDELMSQLNPSGARPTVNATEVQIARLRKKIGRNTIRTIRGLGYVFDLPVDPAANQSSPMERGRCGKSAEDCCG